MAVDAALLELVPRFGYALVFILGILEALPLVGIVVPGHATLLLAGVAASAGLLDIKLVIAAALAAGIIGDALGFYISRRYGKAFLERHGAKLRIKPEHVAKSNAVFEKHGPFALVIVRFSFIARSVGPLLAGMSAMRWRTFWLYNIIGAALWAFGNALGGYFFGISFLAVQASLGRILAYTALSVLGVYLLYRVLRKYAPGFTRGDFLVAMTAIGASAFFGFFADRISDKGLDNVLDRNAGLVTQTFAPLADAFHFLDLATGFLVLGALALVLIVLLAWRRRVWQAVLVAVGMGGVILVATLVQPAFDGFAQGAGEAQFPSQHAAIPLVLVGIVTYLVWERQRRWAPAAAAAIGGFLLVAAASVSRMAQGREYPSSVVAGLVLGLAWFAISLLLVEFAIKRRSAPA